MHTVFAYAVYGEEGTGQTEGFGPGGSPEIGNLTTYMFAVLPVPTITALTADVNPQNVGSNVTFTAYIAPAFGMNTPTGSMTFLDGSTQLGQLSLDGSGHAAFATSLLSPGLHTITANYSGDANYNASSTSITEQVTVTPVITWQTPDAITYGTALSATQLNATANVPLESSMPFLIS